MGSSSFFNVADMPGIGTPDYGDLTDYPERLVLGDLLFPMLPIYYKGDTSMQARIGNPDLFDSKLNEYFAARMGMKTGEGAPSTDGEVKTFNRQVRKWKKEFTSAVDKNQTFLWQLCNATSQLLKQYKSRLPTVKGSYYPSKVGGKTVYDYFPSLYPSDPAALYNCMEVLRMLFENEIIGWDHNLGIRPLNIYTGDFADQGDDMALKYQQMRILGLPVQGLFTVNDIPKTSWMYHTFSGIDITAVASLNTTVSQLDGLTSFSWSLHAGNQAQRTIGKANPGARGSGSRTIAGSMVFAIADHHPLLDIIPSDMPGKNSLSVLQNPEQWRVLMLADQIPPFDVTLVLQNEYGFASIVSLYGVQIMDEGCVLGVDNLVTEMVFQYTAVCMDPIIQCETDAYGYIDPYGLLSGGYSKYFKHREIVIAGVAYSDLENAYEAQYDATFAALKRGIEYNNRLIESGVYDPKRKGR